MLTEKDMRSCRKGSTERTIGCHLPMGLAETKRDNIFSVRQYLLSVVLKIILTTICVVFVCSVYVWVVWRISYEGSIGNQKNIDVTQSISTTNRQTVSKHLEINLMLSNTTETKSFALRHRRNVENNLNTAKLVRSLRELVPQREPSVDTRKEHHTTSMPMRTHGNRDSNNTATGRYPLVTNLFPSSAKSDPTKRHSSDYPIRSNNEGAPRQLTDTCLLAKLMKHVYDNGHMGDQSREYLSNIPSSPMSPFIQYPGISSGKAHLHPQDFDIAMDLYDSKLKGPELSSDELADKITKETNPCPAGKVPCDNGRECVERNAWCDGSVDCADTSDETRCSCKDRVDRMRICDGYFDCPFGEDEMGCDGCNENDFSCEDADVGIKGTCFTKEQRCNNNADCPNHKDELDCIMLSPNLHMRAMFAVSNTEGFLQRNFKGTWYSVCSNPYMWAHDACRRETGLIIRPPYIQILDIDPTLKIEYINMAAGGLTAISSSCMNASAVYVTCPDLMCGTRMRTSAQMLKENMSTEDSFFGRNKRFLVQRRLFPYPFYNKRRKREVPRDSTINDWNKTSGARVVGGKASEPAAWPWMIAVYRNGVFHCGGVIINQNWVMSAAHCVHRFWQHYYEVHSGVLRRLSFSPQEQNHRVTHVIVNHKYNQVSMKNDLSLLLVKPSIQFSRWVRPVCLPSPEVAGAGWLSGPPPGTMCTAVGWGATVERGPDPDHMREVSIPVWEQCTHKDDRAGNEICAGFMEGGKDACQGDSGGPLLCANPSNAKQWYVAGIVSHGDGCARRGEPGAYTRVSLFVPWIKRHIASKTLPIIQPKQDCPGFRCDSGILKCLPKKRMCDNNIDCLDGEDELNCENKRWNVLDIKDLNSTQTESFDAFPIKNTYDTNAYDNAIEQSSTVEFINTKSSSDSLENSEESVTGDPVKIIPSGEIIDQQVTVIDSTTENYNFTDKETRSNSEQHTFVDHLNGVANDSLSADKTQTDELKLSTLDNEHDVQCHDEHSHNSTNSTQSNLNLDLSTNSSNNESIHRGDIVQDTSETLVVKATQRKRFINPSVFECTRIQQSIPYQHRCDQKADCEDGTDELECSCADYLTAFDSSLICDGVNDCSDGQDEYDCYECEEKQFLCKRDNLCVDTRHVCDGTRQCPSGDDEVDCLVLTNGKQVWCDVNGKPLVNLHGYVTKKYNNSWHISCEENISPQAQDDAANYVCRYLGFSSAQGYSIKYVNVKHSDLLSELNNRNKRNTNETIPIQYIYKQVDGDSKMARDVLIGEPELVSEHCVPNITQTCMALYVVCDASLFNLEIQAVGRAVEESVNIDWPWVAKLYIDGNYKCTGVLVDLSWVLVSQYCLSSTMFTYHYLTVILGSHKTLATVKGPHEEVYDVDIKRELYRSKVTLLHLKKSAKYKAMIKPMVVSSHVDDKNTTCVAVGQNKLNRTFAIFLNEYEDNCRINHRCFTYQSDMNICQQESSFKAALIVSCHSRLGWYPAGTFAVEDSCNSNRIIAYEIENLKHEMKYQKGVPRSNSTQLEHPDDCVGVRCERGRCLSLHDVCNGVVNCADAKDETAHACQIKTNICTHDPYNKGCECASHELKCRNGRCISKELFRNGRDDCGDATDEPEGIRCSDYLSRVAPSRLCDGILNCFDRSDEDPNFCKCFAQKGFDCRAGKNDQNYCVAMDMVCDGTRDCPNGEDERACMALSSPPETPSGMGQVVVRAHGVWHTKCYPSQNHTKSDLEGICRQLGFHGGHAKQVVPHKNMSVYPHNDIVVDTFSNIVLNNVTSIKLRNTHLSMAIAVANGLENCYPLFIECL